MLDGLVIFVGTIPGWILIVIAIVGAASTADANGRIHNEAAGAFVGIMVHEFLSSERIVLQFALRVGSEMGAGRAAQM